MGPSLKIRIISESLLGKGASDGAKQMCDAHVEDSAPRGRDAFHIPPEPLAGTEVSCSSLVNLTITFLPLLHLYERDDSSGFWQKPAHPLTPPRGL